MMKEGGWEETDNISKISLHRQEDIAEELQQESKNEDHEKKAATTGVYPFVILWQAVFFWGGEAC